MEYGLEEKKAHSNMVPYEKLNALLILIKSREPLFEQ